MKKYVSLVFTVVFALALISGAYAHPGRTDTSGGHRDHFTGSYHYHHGKSAHQHKDLDGDGNLDCPYNFNKRTNPSSGNTSNSSRTMPITTPKPTPTPENKEPLSFFSVVKLIFGILFFFSYLFFMFVYPFISDARKRKQQEENVRKYWEEERRKEAQKRYAQGAQKALDDYLAEKERK